MYLDFDSKALFGDQPVPLASKRQREFKANDPEAVRTYIEAKYGELEQHNLRERVCCLENLQTEDHSFVERLDRDMTRAAIIATKKIKKTRGYPWSPMLSKAWAVLHLYKLHLSELRNPGISLQASISGWKSRHQGMPSEIPVTEAEAKRIIRDAFKNLQRVRQASAEYRRQHLDHKADIYAALGDVKKEKIMERMQNADSLHRAYDKLRHIRNPINNSGLSAIQTPRESNMDPKDDDRWQTIWTPREVERLLIKRNWKHFGQASGTPLTNPVTWNQLTYDGTGQLCDMILQGTYTNDNLDDAAQLFISRKTSHQQM